MAHPDFVRPVRHQDVSYTAGGPVAILHDGLETRLHLSHLPEWTAYTDMASPADETLHLASRVIGLLALAAGLAATMVFVF